MRQIWSFSPNVHIALKNKKKLARPTRFERVAFAFGGRRPIQLSYGCLSLTQCLREFLVDMRARCLSLNPLNFRRLSNLAVC
jgi:hypothetical protein